MDKDIHIVACTKTKIWNKNKSLPKEIPARFVYSGGMFNQAIDYFKKHLEKYGNEPTWYILSAKYGFLSPNEKIKNYNISFINKNDNYITEKELEKQFYNLNIPSESKNNIVVWGGKEYSNKLNFLKNKYNIISPAYGLTIGRAIQALKNYKENRINII